MNHRWLHLHLCAPLMSFGGVAIDQLGPTRDFPAASALTGLFGNAMGWRWQDRAVHQALQDRLIFGVGIARQGKMMTDNQNARVYEGESGWTTWGEPDARNKGPSYTGKPQNSQFGDQEGRKWLTHRRQRDYLADHDCHVVLRLIDDAVPGLEELAVALQSPARPLFIGRKPCLPSAPLFSGWVEGDTARTALVNLGVDWSACGEALWPEPHDLPEGARLLDLSDLRNWGSGLHGGSRRVVLGRLE